MAGPTPHMAAVSGEHQAPPGQKVMCDYVEMTAHVEQKQMHMRLNLTDSWEGLWEVQKSPVLRQPSCHTLLRTSPLLCSAGPTGAPIKSFKK